MRLAVRYPPHGPDYSRHYASAGSNQAWTTAGHTPSVRVPTRPRLQSGTHQPDSLAGSHAFVQVPTGHGLQSGGANQALTATRQPDTRLQCGTTQALTTADTAAVQSGTHGPATAGTHVFLQSGTHRPDYSRTQKNAFSQLPTSQVATRPLHDYSRTHALQFRYNQPLTTAGQHAFSQVTTWANPLTWSSPHLVLRLTVVPPPHCASHLASPPHLVVALTTGLTWSHCLRPVSSHLGSSQTTTVPPPSLVLTRLLHLVLVTESSRTPVTCPHPLTWCLTLSSPTLTWFLTPNGRPHLVSLTWSCIRVCLTPLT
ncbi:unnamed protein product [Boreogadus saida]